MLPALRLSLTLAPSCNYDLDIQYEIRLYLVDILHLLTEDCHARVSKCRFDTSTCAAASVLVLEFERFHSKRLDEILEQTASLLDRDLKLRRSVVSALVYPAIVATLIVIAVALAIGDAMIRTGGAAAISG